MLVFVSHVTIHGQNAATYTLGSAYLLFLVSTIFFTVSVTLSDPSDATVDMERQFRSQNHTSKLFDSA